MQEQAPRPAHCSSFARPSERRWANGFASKTRGSPIVAADGNVVAGGFTSGNGAYRITSIPAGTYTVNFTLPGWTVVEETGVVITAGQTTSLAVTMAERSFSLNPITVTTSRRVEKALDAPAAIEVISTTST